MLAGQLAMFESPTFDCRMSRYIVNDGNILFRFWWHSQSKTLHFGTESISTAIYYLNPWTSETHAHPGLSTGVVEFHYVSEDYY
jgi:hypothetical protein